jgi:hypothetical protein
MIGESWFATVALLVASALWAALAAHRVRHLVRARGEVVSVRTVPRGRGMVLWPVVRFSVSGEYQEVEIRENGTFQVGNGIEVLYPQGEPAKATLRPRPFHGPLILLLFALLFAIAALS